MTTLLDLCSLIRSKNAGPFVLTFDFIARDETTYRRLVDSGILTTQLFADLYGADPEQILLMHHDAAQAVKVSFPRPVRQGSLDDSDSYGGQQYAPLVDLVVDAAGDPAVSPVPDPASPGAGTPAAAR